MTKAVVDLTEATEQNLTQIDPRAPSGNSDDMARISAYPLPKLENKWATARLWRVSGGIALVAAVLIAGVSYWPGDSAPERNDASVVVARSGYFTMRVTEFGEIRALDSGTVSAATEYPIIYLVPEGTKVTKGDVLVRQNSEKYEAELDESIATHKVAQANMRKAEKDLEAQRHKLLADIARIEASVRLSKLTLDEFENKPLPDELATARMQLEQAELTFAIAKKRRDILVKLLKKGFVTNSAMEQAELKVLETEMSRQVAQFNLKKVSAGATPVELERAEIQLRDAKFALAKAREGMASQVKSYQAAVDRERANVERANKLVKKSKVKLKRAQLRAQRDGLVVYARGKSGRSAQKIQLGMIPFRGQPLIYLPDLSMMVVDIEVNEFDLAKLSLGQPAEIRLEAYPGSLFQGKVSKIAPLAKVKQNADGTGSGIKVFDVTVKIAEKDPRLKPGLTATVDIIAYRRDDAISIPMVAVNSQGDKHYIRVARAGQIEKRAVTLGPSNDDRVIVEDGLRPGEKVLLDAPLSKR